MVVVRGWEGRGKMGEIQVKGSEVKLSVIRISEALMYNRVTIINNTVLST